MSQAYENEPTRDGDQLVFDDGSVRLVYKAFTDPQPAELFAVLGDPSLSVDESQLPPENVTGSVPPDFKSLVPLPSPSNDVDLFLGTIDGNVCIVYGTHDAMDKWCDSARLVAVRSPYARRPSTSRSTVL